jgi:hypothetical protein
LEATKFKIAKQNYTMQIACLWARVAEERLEINNWGLVIEICKTGSPTNSLHK